MLLELKGENIFKARAYYNAARTVENLEEDLEVLIDQGRLREVPGFGKAISSKIIEWNKTGSIEYYDDLKNSTPPGLVELLRLPGLGPKKVSQLYVALGVTNLEMLEKACQQNWILSVPGFGLKTQEKICAGIKFIKDHRGMFLWAEAYEIGIKLYHDLLKSSAVLRVEIAGSLRRYREVVKDIDLVAASTEPQVVRDYFIKMPIVAEVKSSGLTKTSVLLSTGNQVDLRVVKPEEFPHALQHFTGSKEHNTALRHLAKKLGYKLNEYGLFKGDKGIYCQDEAEIYQYLGLSFIPPELREDLGEIERAREDSLPSLVQPEDLKGILHLHTNYSDGVNSLEELIAAAIEEGYHYIGVTDHSQTAVYARGLTREMVFRQWEEIDRLNEKYSNFKIFKGIEADILPNGELDYDPDFLKNFDFVIGSIHSQFRMGKEEMTKRILKAMENPALTILGHPTGRILLERSGYDLDLDAIITKAAEKEVILEFNANPYRLDLDWRWCRRAKEQGVLIAINPDAHSIGELNFARSGLLVARKGWLEQKDVLNTRDVGEIGEIFKGNRLVNEG